MQQSAFAAIRPNTFAAACYDQNSISELVAALAGEPDQTDMKTWRLTALEWRAQIEMALAAKREDADARHGS
jgi:hypothetical protein